LKLSPGSATRHTTYSSRQRTWVQTDDADLLAEAETKGFIVLTEDKDFGELVYRDRRNSHGVILLRMMNSPVTMRLARLRDAWPEIESNLPGAFVVVSLDKRRARPLTVG
jgi:predicted nuclease of predicted toxin-antitoxin system